MLCCLPDQGVRDTLRIQSITGEVGEDGIEVGDQLIKLDGVDVSTMPLVRGSDQTCTWFRVRLICCVIFLFYCSGTAHE